MLRPQRHEKTLRFKTCGQKLKSELVSNPVNYFPLILRYILIFFKRHALPDKVANLIKCLGKALLKILLNILKNIYLFKYLYIKGKDNYNYYL